MIKVYFQRIYLLGLVVLLLAVCLVVGLRSFSVGDDGDGLIWSELADSSFVNKPQPRRVYAPRVQSERRSFVRREREKNIKIELNCANEADLKRLRGIGEVLSARIVEYRKKLGGFHSTEQILEVRGIDKALFNELNNKILVDVSEIQKININFVARNTLLQHPYFTRSMTERIVKGRQSKGGFFNTQELIDNDILTPKEARKVAPYLSFGTDLPKEKDL